MNMHLEHITEEVCPCCNAKPVTEMKGIKMGVAEEAREFRCGAVIVWSERFKGMHPHASRPCPVDPVIVAREDRRAQAAQRLRKQVDHLKVDEEFKRALLERLHPAKIGY